MNHAFQSMLDTVPGAWFFARRDGTLAYVNSGACASLGYARQDVGTVSIFDLDPTITPHDWGVLWESTKAGDSVVLCTRHRRRDGTDFPVEVRATRVILDGEELTASYTIDLTTTEQTREALQQTEQRLQRLLSHIPDLVFTLSFSPEPHFRYLSHRATTLLGYEPELLIGSSASLRRIVHPEDWERFLRMPSVDPDTSESLRFVHAEGRLVWLEVRATRLEGVNGVLRVEGVARDVSRTYDAERANRRLAAALDHAAEAVVVADAQGLVEFVNAAYERSSGLTSAEALGRRWVDLEVDSADTVRAAVARVQEDGTPWCGRFSTRRDSGKWHWEETNISPVRDPLGKVAGCVAVKRDITEQVELEMQLRHAQKMEAVGQLAGSVAHDFNNLLQIIQGNATLLARRRDSTGSEPFLREVLMATDRAVQLVRQLLAFSRKDSIELVRIDLVLCIGAMIDMLRRLLGSRIEVVWECDLDRAVVVGNAIQLEQVVMNLCINARDAMPNGGRLRLTLDRVSGSEVVPLALRERGDSAYYQLKVDDTGCGIPEEHRERVFEPFFTMKAPGKGTGLGLATVYSIVEAHQGTIVLESMVGQGTTFRVYLPCGNGECHAENCRPPAVHSLGKGRLVLVAEDEAAVRRLTAYHLEEAGFRVVLASDGEQAVQQIDRYGSQLDCAVLDAVMPLRTGFEVYEELRKRGHVTPVLFVTGYDYAMLPKAESERSIVVLQKPFTEEVLMEKLHELLETSMPALDRAR